MRFSHILPAYQDSILASVRRLHQFPELSEQEYETTEYIRAFLLENGIEVLNYPIKTGVLAMIHGSKPGPTIALRADIDALPITEDEANPVISQRSGVMHACGHDVHTAALLGAAAMLNSRKDDLSGQILLIFQPSEELSTGAIAVTDSGVFRDHRPSAFFSMHVMPDIAEGQISVQSGPIMAAQEGFTIEVYGKGSHGAAPHLSHDPIIAAADIVNALQKLDSRMIDPMKPFVLSVCSLHGGAAFNIVPETCTIMGTCRYLHNELREHIVQSITSIAEHAAAMYGCRADTSFYKSLPANVNHPSLLQIAADCAATVFGHDAVMQAPMRMSSEDFSIFAGIAPTFMYHVGCGKAENSPPLHNSCFCVSDRVLLDSAVLVAETAAAALAAL